MGIKFLLMHCRKLLRKHGTTICGGTIRSSSTHSTGCLSLRWCVPNATRSLWPSTPSATWACPYLLVRRGSWRCSMYRWIPWPNPPRFVLCHILIKQTAKYHNAQSLLAGKVAYVQHDRHAHYEWAHAMSVADVNDVALQVCKQEERPLVVCDDVIRTCFA